MLASMSPELQKEMEVRTTYDIIKKLKSMYQTQVSQEFFETQKILNSFKDEGGTIG